MPFIIKLSPEAETQSLNLQSREKTYFKVISHGFGMFTGGTKKTLVDAGAILETMLFCQQQQNCEKIRQRWCDGSLVEMTGESLRWLPGTDGVIKYFVGVKSKWKAEVCSG